MLLLGRVPSTSDRVQWDGWMFEVVAMDGKRIDKVLATPVDISDESESDAAATEVDDHEAASHR